VKRQTATSEALTAEFAKDTEVKGVDLTALSRRSRRPLLFNPEPACRELAERAEGRLACRPRVTNYDLRVTNSLCFLDRIMKFDIIIIALACQGSGRATKKRRGRKLTALPHRSEGRQSLGEGSLENRPSSHDVKALYAD